MKTTKNIALWLSILFLSVFIASEAEARRKKHVPQPVETTYEYDFFDSFSDVSTGLSIPSARYNAGPKPRRYCGWYMRRLFGGGPQYNRARNWANRGTPTHPRPGAIIAWKSHVGLLVKQVRGDIWIVHSGNDGGKIRSRPRSIRGGITRWIGS